MNGVDADHPVLGAFFERLADAGHPLHRRKIDSCWAASLPKDWETFLAGCSKHRRKRMRRMQRKILDATETQFHLPKNRGELRTAFSVLNDLHLRRRRMLRDYGYLDKPRMAAFLDEVTPLMFSEGRVLIPWIEYQSQPLGAE